MLSRASAFTKFEDVKGLHLNARHCGALVAEAKAYLLLLPDALPFLAQGPFGHRSKLCSTARHTWDIAGCVHARHVSHRIACRDRAEKLGELNSRSIKQAISLLPMTKKRKTLKIQKKEEPLEVLMTTKRHV